MPSNRRADLARGARQIATKNGVIDFFNGPVAELIRQADMRGVVLCNNEAPARVLIKPMNDSWPRVAGDAAQFSLAMMKQSVHQSMLIIPRAWMHHQVGRLV